MLQAKTYDVIVIGAGMAGLAAAAHLGAHGRRVVILEARDRMGGRAFTTVSAESGRRVELGAEFVHGRHPLLFEMIEQAGLKAVEVSEDHESIRDGEEEQGVDIWEDVEKVFSEMMKKEGEPDTTFGAFLSGLDVSDGVKQGALGFAEGFNAAEADKLSVQGLIVDQKASDEIDGDSTFRIDGGFRALLDDLVEQCRLAGVETVLRKEVARIEWERENVRVVCADDSVYSAKQCVVTLPMGVLQARKVVFEPALDAKFAHIDRIVMGKVVRVVFELTERLWDDSTSFMHVRDAEHFPVWWTQAPSDAPLLTGWASGKFAIAMDGMPREAKLSLAKSGACSLFDLSPEEFEKKIVDVHFHDWDSDPYSLGAYCYIAVDGLPAQQELARPVEDTLFFAGEATVTAGYIGTIHGALVTGKRAANEILNT